jgi:hypothetical protein
VQQQEVLNMSKLVTAAVAGMTGKNAQAAVDAAAVAVINNFNSRTFPKRAKEIVVAKDYLGGNPLNVNAGQFTFDLEGNDQQGTRNDSRVLHHPDKNSGVTLGRGVDLKDFTPEMVDALFTAAGFPAETVEVLKRGIKLYGSDADDYIKKYGSTIGRISAEQQNALFQISYKLKEEYASEVYGRAYSSLVGVKNSSANWVDLDSKIRTIYVDLIYQGLNPSFSRGNLIPAMQTNDLTSFKNGLVLYDTDPTGMRFRSRNVIRLDYLK